MKPVLAVTALALFFSTCAGDEIGKPDIASADALFVAGRFAEAGKLYARIAEQDPKQ